MGEPISQDTNIIRTNTRGYFLMIGKWYVPDMCPG